MKLLIEMLDPGVFEENLNSNLSVLQDIFDANNYSVSNVMNMVIIELNILFNYFLCSLINFFLIIYLIL
jgi:hypothetical protein